MYKHTRGDDEYNYIYGIIQMNNYLKQIPSVKKNAHKKYTLAYVNKYTLTFVMYPQSGTTNTTTVSATYIHTQGDDKYNYNYCVSHIHTHTEG